MSDELVGTREWYICGWDEGYTKAINDFFDILKSFKDHTFQPYQVEIIAKGLLNKNRS